MVHLNHLPLYSLALSLANQNGVDATHQNAALLNHRSVPEISTNIAHLHQALKAAQAVAEDQDSMIQVSGQGLQDVLERIKALEDEVSAMLPSKASSSPPSPTPDSANDVPNEPADDTCSAPLSSRDSGDVSDPSPFRRSANCVAGASKVAQDQDQTENLDIAAEPSHEVDKESPMAETSSVLTFVKSDRPTLKNPAPPIVTTTSAVESPNVAALFKGVSPIVSGSPEAAPETTPEATPEATPETTPISDSSPDNDLISSFSTNDPIATPDSQTDDSTSPTSGPEKPAEPISSEEFTTLDFTSTTRRTETVTRTRTKTISLTRPTPFIKMITDERPPTISIGNETPIQIPYYANTTFGANRTAPVLESAETQPSSSILTDLTVDGAQLAPTTGLSKREYRLSLSVTSSGFKTVSTPRAARPMRKRYH